jgi:hypothetical protein
MKIAKIKKNEQVKKILWDQNHVTSNVNENNKRFILLKSVGSFLDTKTNTILPSSDCGEIIIDEGQFSVEECLLNDEWYHALSTIDYMWIKRYNYNFMFDNKL